MCLSKCIKFKTNSLSFLNRIEALNSSLLEKIQNKQKREEPPPSAEAAAAHEGQLIFKNELPNPLPAGTSSAIPTQTPSGAGVKKKKPKKKKGGP
jgi:signal recognition particle subunit SRP9